MRRFLTLVGICALWPMAAVAGLEICNQTGGKQSVSIGYKQGGDWVSEGWWNIAPGACTEPVKGELKNRYYYFRATASGQTFTGDYAFCTQGGAYTIVGDTECEARGYRSEDFSAIDTGKSARSFSFALTAENTGAGQSTAKTGETKVPEAVQETGNVIRSGLVRGAHGEPYADVVMFQGCDVFDGFEACSFIGNGWKFFAGYDDPTPRGFLVRLEALPLNTPVSIKGDLTSYGDSSAQLAISEIEIMTGADPYAHLRRAMQGNWVSADDPNSTLFIHGSEMHSYYGNEFIDTMYLDVQADCPDSAGAGPVMIQTSQQYRDNYCYLIDNLQGGWMDLILMGHEALLSYRKTD